MRASVTYELTSQGADKRLSSATSVKQGAPLYKVARVEFTLGTYLLGTVFRRWVSTYRLRSRSQRASARVLCDPRRTTRRNPFSRDAYCLVRGGCYRRGERKGTLRAIYYPTHHRDRWCELRRGNKGYYKG